MTHDEFQIWEQCQLRFFGDAESPRIARIFRENAIDARSHNSKLADLFDQVAIAREQLHAYARARLDAVPQS